MSHSLNEINEIPRKTIFFWVSASSPFNSIQIQIQLIAKIISRLFNVKTQILHPNSDNLKRKLSEISKSNDILFWHYGGFDTYLNIFKKNQNIIFVYHNITPAKYFWRTEPLVSIRSIIGKIQLKLINKNHKWITMSDYNVNELKDYGFKNILLCPNIVSTCQIEPIEKSKIISLIYVGRIAPNKNCISLLEHIEKVSNQIRLPINLVVVGSLKPGCKFGIKFTKKYETMLSHPYLRVNWENDVNEQKLNELYKKSWLYVSMSLHEGFGVPACESIANGTPAIYLESGGQESVLNKIGMVSKKEEDLFYRYLIELILDKHKRLLLYQDQIKIVNKLISPQVDKLIFETYKHIIS